jgi:hypothetical protein
MQLGTPCMWSNEALCLVKDHEGGKHARLPAAEVAAAAAL